MTNSPAPLPHDDYARAVADALAAAGTAPATWFTSTPDGHQLDAVFNMAAGTFDPDAWPDGVYLGWDQNAGWDLTDNAGNRNTYPLGLEMFASPAAVAGRTRTRLLGLPDTTVDELWAITDEARRWVADIEAWSTRYCTQPAETAPGDPTEKISGPGLAAALREHAAQARVYAQRYREHTGYGYFDPSAADETDYAQGVNLLTRIRRTSDAAAYQHLGAALIAERALTLFGETGELSASGRSGAEVYAALCDHAALLLDTSAGTVDRDVRQQAAEDGEPVPGSGVLAWVLEQQDESRAWHPHTVDYDYPAWQPDNIAALTARQLAEAVNAIEPHKTVRARVWDVRLGEENARTATILGRND